MTDSRGFSPLSNPLIRPRRGLPRGAGAMGHGARTVGRWTFPRPAILCRHEPVKLAKRGRRRRAYGMV